MKLRAPRCRDAVLVTSSSARHVIQSAPEAPPASVGATAAPLARTPASRSAARLRVLMKNHSFGHRLHLIDTRVPRHQEEESEIAAGEDARQDHVHPFGRLQAEIAEYAEGDGED